jgi:hypothetical protein
VGAVGAVLIVVGIDLVRSGELPDPSLITYYSRLFASQGFGMIAMPAVGLYWALYVTFSGALVLAASRARWAHSDQALTGLLAWAGVFGLAAGAYYAGRSNSYSLIGLFPAWGVAIAVLTLCVWRRVTAAVSVGAAARRAGPLGLATLVAFGLAATTVTSIAAPWSQIERIASTSDDRDTFALDPVVRFVAKNTSRGEPVLFIGQNGHLIARDAGVRNVSPIGDPFHVVATEQLDDLFAALDEADGSTVFTLDSSIPAIRLRAGLTANLRERGYIPVAAKPDLALTAWRQPIDGG